MAYLISEEAQDLLKDVKKILWQWSEGTMQGIR